MENKYFVGIDFERGGGGGAEVYLKKGESEIMREEEDFESGGRSQMGGLGHSGPD